MLCWSSRICRLCVYFSYTFCCVHSDGQDKIVDRLCFGLHKLAIFCCFWACIEPLEWKMRCDCKVNNHERSVCGKATMLHNLFISDTAAHHQTCILGNVSVARTKSAHLFILCRSHRPMLQLLQCVWIWALDSWEISYVLDHAHVCEAALLLYCNRLFVCWLFTLSSRRWAYPIGWWPNSIISIEFVFVSGQSSTGMIKRTDSVCPGAGLMSTDLSVLFCNSSSTFQNTFRWQSDQYKVRWLSLREAHD